MPLIKPVQMNIDPMVNGVDQEYEGIVEDNLDPLMLGRVKVRYGMVEDADEEDLPWCYPTANVFLGNSKDSISFSVPEIGSSVKVYYPTKDRYLPYYKGTSFNGDNMCTFFADDDYPNVYGFKDSVGNFVRVNTKKKTIQIQHSSTGNFFVDSDGSVTGTLPDGSFFEFFTGGTWKLSSGSGATSVITGTADGTITLDCQNLNVNANCINLNGQQTNIKGSCIIETGDSGPLPLVGGIATVQGGIVTSIMLA